MSERLVELAQQYANLAHAVQSGIATLLGAGKARMCEPKHMRVGLDMARADAGALAELLIAKGVFTSEEYHEALVRGAQREVDSYTQRVRQELGTDKVTLG